MAPYYNFDGSNIPGFWGNITSTLDWCERNYEVSFYVAEFWNTLSNLGILLPNLLGCWFSWKDHVEFRYILSFLSVAFVGVGSWCFHMTLQYSMQLADEVPMLWTGLVVLYCSLEVPSGGKVNQNLVFGLTSCGLTITLIYIFFREPVIFQTSYGLAIVAMIIQGFRLTRNTKCISSLFFWACGLSALGFFLWNIDNQLCPLLRRGRDHLPFPVRPFTQLHAWWHVLAGYASYLHIVFSLHARCHVLRRRTNFAVTWYGPTLRCDDSKSV